MEEAISALQLFCQSNKAIKHEFINNREKLGKLGIIVGSIMFILGLISFYLLYSTKADLKAMEDDFDKNGGFIWGDES